MTYYPPDQTNTEIRLMLTGAPIGARLLFYAIKLHKRAPNYHHRILQSKSTVYALIPSTILYILITSHCRMITIIQWNLHPFQFYIVFFLKIIVSLLIYSKLSIRNDLAYIAYSCPEQSISYVFSPAMCLISVVYSLLSMKVLCCLMLPTDIFLDKANVKGSWSVSTVNTLPSARY